MEPVTRHKIQRLHVVLITIKNIASRAICGRTQCKCEEWLKKILPNKIPSALFGAKLILGWSYEVRLIDWSFTNSEKTCVREEVQFITDDLILITGK